VDAFQSDEFRVPKIEPARAPATSVATAVPVSARKSYPYTTGLLAVIVAVAGGVIGTQMVGTSGFGWFAAIWLLLFVLLLARLITDLANRPRG